MGIRKKRQMISAEFERNARLAFPNYRSMYDITKELNKLLEEAINNGTRKKRKHY